MVNNDCLQLSPMGEDLCEDALLQLDCSLIKYSILLSQSQVR